MIVRNKIKCLLINLLLLAGVYCSWGCSCCADCYKKCCGKEDNKNEIENNNNETSEENKEQKDLYFKIQEGTIDNNKLGCFGNEWFKRYNMKIKYNHNNTVLLYGLEEQQGVPNGTDGTLVYSPKSKKLQYTNGGSFPKDLKDSDNKWAIFKVTALNKDNKATPGESHIFYCSDVSSLDKYGLFEEIECWSIEILAANTQGVETFRAMFHETKSYLEQDIKKPGASGFIGLEKLDLSSAWVLSYMFYNALFKQETINSLRELRLRNGAYIAQMFYVDISKFVGQNGPDFSVLKGWIKRKGSTLVCKIGHKYNIFFKGKDKKQNNDKLPDWYENNIKKS
ncbi:MAG: hypothetical protein II393_02385 [Cytophagales bacterium]|nr:hypothetical protein [Cytophagales bacterium]